MSTPSISGSREQWATRAIFLIAGAVWIPMAPYAESRLGSGGTVPGLIPLGLSSIVAMPIAGLLATRFGCRNVILGSGVVIILILPILALAASRVQLILALAAFGAAIGAADVAMNIQAVIVEKHANKPMMSGFHALFGVGGIIGIVGGSLLCSPANGPLGVMLTASTLGLLALVISTKGLLPYGNSEAGHTPLFVMPRGVIVGLGILCFLVFVAEGSVRDSSAAYMTTMRNVDPGQAGFGYAAFALATTMGRFAGDHVVRVIGRPRILLFGGALSALGFAIVILAAEPWFVYGGYLLAGLGASNVVPVLLTAAGRQTVMPPSLAIAAITTIGYLGFLASPAIIGFVARTAGVPAAFALLTLGMLAIAASYRIAKE